jgi:hypothetical protein
VISFDIPLHSLFPNLIWIGFISSLLALLIHRFVKPQIVKLLALVFGLVVVVSILLPLTKYFIKRSAVPKQVVSVENVTVQDAIILTKMSDLFGQTGISYCGVALEKSSNPVLNLFSNKNPKDAAVETGEAIFWSYEFKPVRVERSGFTAYVLGTQGSLNTLYLTIIDAKIFDGIKTVRPEYVK